MLVFHPSLTATVINYPPLHAFTEASFPGYPQDSQCMLYALPCGQPFAAMVLLILQGSITNTNVSTGQTYDLLVFRLTTIRDNDYCLPSCDTLILVPITWEKFGRVDTGNS
jgi:hypothetical protein